MDGDWIQHFEGAVEGRQVVVESHTDGGYRVRTTQLGDYDGSVYSDGRSTLIIPPIAAGSRIDIEAASLEELREELAREHFGLAAIDEMVGYFPT